jgi:hypothetical protein
VFLSLNLWQKIEADLRRTKLTDIKTTNTNATQLIKLKLIQIKPNATDMPAISKEDSFNQLTIAELEKVLLAIILT